MTDSHQIKKIAVKFYKQLYKPTTTSPSIHDDFLKEITQNLTNAESENLDADITPAEIKKKLIKSSAKGKTPGPDGLGTEFYKEMYDIIKEDLAEIVNEMYKGDVLTTQQQEIIHLIHKKGKQRRSRIISRSRC